MLPNTNKANLRLVSHHFKDVIDEFCVYYKVVLDDTKSISDVQRISQLRLKSLSVENFETPWDTLVAEPGSTFFRHPDVLRKLKVKKDVSPKNLAMLLKETSPHLEKLGLYVPFLVVCEDGEYLDDSINLQNLKQLDLCANMEPSGIQPEVENGKEEEEVTPKREYILIQQVLGSVLSQKGKGKMTSLRVLTTCRCFQVGSLVSQTLAIVAKNYSTLKEVSILLHNDGDPEVTTSPQEITNQLKNYNLHGLLKVKSLERFRVLSTFPPGFGVDFWLAILNIQMRLGVVLLDLNLTSFPLPPHDMLNNVVFQSHEVLVILDLSFQTIVPEQSKGTVCFDVKVLKNCKSLKRLALGEDLFNRRQGTGQSTPVKLSGMIKNFHCIPENVVDLSIFHLGVFSNELLTRFTWRDDSPPLKIFKLTDCLYNLDVTSERLGVNGSVLETIMRNPNWELLELQPLNFVNPREAQKLNRLLCPYGFSRQTPRLGLFRITELGTEYI